MIKGILIALALLLVGDLTLNEGQVTHFVHARLGHYATASSEAVNGSIFRK